MRRERVIRWLVLRIPEPILAAPERVLINFACALIGVAALVYVQPGSLLSLWPRWAAIEWAAAMLVGGTCALIGFWKSWRSVARLGYLLLGVEATVYAVGVVIEFGGRGIATALIWLSIAGAKGIRLLVGSALRNSILQAGRDYRP